MSAKVRMENNIGNTNIGDSSKVAMAPITPAINVTVTNFREPTRLVEFNPAYAALIVALVISFLVVGFASGFLKRCIRPVEDDDDDGQPRSRSSRRTVKPQRGLDPEIVESLPFIQYKDLPERIREELNCSVCLAAFDANDCLRLLPECSHAFHSDCIDAWFRSHNTCPLCRACLAHPSREEREGNAESNGEQPAPEGSDIVEVVISGDLEQDSRPAISRLSPGRNGGALVTNSSSAKEEEKRVCTHPFLLSNSRETFKPAVRVVIAHEKAAALVSMRRSNSTGTGCQLLHPSFVVDSEGTQHNRNYQTHAINVEEFLSKGEQSQSTESHPVSLAQHNWLPADLESGASSEIHPISRLEIQRPWRTICRFLNLRHIARP